jgi:DNA-binding FadR family transcriptional regulator
LSAVARGDAAAAENAMRRHLRDAIHYIERWLLENEEAQLPSQETHAVHANHSEPGDGCRS